MICTSFWSHLLAFHPDHNPESNNLDQYIHGGMRKGHGYINCYQRCKVRHVYIVSKTRFLNFLVPTYSPASSLHPYLRPCFKSFPRKSLLQTNAPWKNSVCPINAFDYGPSMPKNKKNIHQHQCATFARTGPITCTNYAHPTWGECQFMWKYVLCRLDLIIGILIHPTSCKYAQRERERERAYIYSSKTSLH